MIRLFFILATLVAVEVRAEVDSIVSHYYVGEGDERGEVPREKAVASMYVIRPASITANPKEYLGPRWATNRAEAARLRGVFREGVEREYREYGLKGELTAEQKDDLDTILKRDGSVIAICEPDHPEKILQIVSFAYDSTDGLPLERHHKVKAIDRKPPEWRFAQKRFIECFGEFYEDRLNSLILSLSPTYEGDVAELKTFIRGKKSQQDWIPTILRSMVSMELLRHGTKPMPKDATQQLKAFRDANAHVIQKALDDRAQWLLEVAGSPQRAASYREGILDRIYDQDTQKTVGIDEIRIQVHGDKLVETYTKTYGFHHTGITLKHGDNRDDWVHVLAISRAELENVAVDKLTDRKGIALVRKHRYNLADNGDQPCAHDFSQIGTKVAPTLGTRGVILGDPNFRLW